MGKGYATSFIDLFIYVSRPDGLGLRYQFYRSLYLRTWTWCVSLVISTASLHSCSAVAMALAARSLICICKLCLSIDINSFKQTDIRESSRNRWNDNHMLCWNDMGWKIGINTKHYLDTQELVICHKLLTIIVTLLYIRSGFFRLS